MAQFDEIAVLRNGEVENVDTTGNIFKFETIRFGINHDLTELRASRLINLQNGSDVDTSHHTHNSIYFTKTELGSTTALSGALNIGIDDTYAYQSLIPVTATLDEAIKQIDNRLANISSEFDMNAFRVLKNGDPTAKLQIDVAALSTGVTRKLIMPNYDVNLGNITTTDYVDNAVSLAISGLSPKPAVKAATRPKDWLPTVSNDFFGIKVDDGSQLHLVWIRIYRAPDAGGGNWVFWFSTAGAVGAPTTGTLGTHRIDVLTTDTQEQAFDKMVAVMQPILSTEYDVFPFPLGQAAIGDVQLLNQTPGLTPAIEVSDTVKVAVNKVDSYGESVTRGFNGVTYSQIGDTLLVENMRSNFSNDAPAIDGITLNIGDRILIKDQPAGDQRFNGIWVITGLPSISSIEVERPVDVDGKSGFPEVNVNTEVTQGIYTFVSDGTDNKNMGFIMITPGLITVNSNDQVWTPFKAEKQITVNTTTAVYPFIQIDDYMRINVGPLLYGQMIGGSNRNDVAPVNTTSALSDILLDIDSDGIGGLKIKDQRITDSMVMNGTLLKESQTFFGATNITGAEAETLTNGSNADALHVHNTTFVAEGTNLYFTQPRVRSTTLTGFDPNLSGDIVATDTILQAFGKVQHAITSNLEPNKADSNLDNLVNTAVNITIKPGAAVTTADLGATGNKWRSLYLSTNALVDGVVSAPSHLFPGLANDTALTNGSLWALNDAAKTLRYKQGNGTTDDVVLKALAQTLTGKTMDFTGPNTITVTTTQVTEGTNLYYTTARWDARLATKTTSDLAEGTNLYYTQARFDAALAAKTTTNLAEGTNQYFTQARVIASPITGFVSGSGALAATDTLLQAINKLDGNIALRALDSVVVKTVNGQSPTAGAVTITTTNIAEGTNLYYTQARFDTAFTAKSTTDLAEGTNLYYTDSRADARITLQKGAANGLATLGADSKIPTSQLPALAITDVSVVADIAARNALTVEEGDVAKVLDADGNGNPASFIYDGSTWISLKSDDAVDSVNGQTGTVVLSTTDISEGTNLYYTQGRFDTALAAKSTSDLAEGANLYYTQARFDTAFGLKSTTNLAEGTNLYYTAARFNSAFAAKTTSDLTEGVNLYYTAARFDGALATKTTDDLAESATKKYITTAAQTIAGEKTFSDTLIIGARSIATPETVALLNVDWSASNIFEKSISANETFTFSNDLSGQTIIVKVANTSGASVTATFPAGIKWQGATAVTSVPANRTNLYTFVKIGTEIIASCIDDVG